MKRQLILGLILVLLAGAAFGTYFFVDHYQAQKEAAEIEKAKALQLSDLNSDDVQTITIHTADMDYTLEKGSSSNQWNVAEGSSDMNVNNSYLSTICTYGSALTASEDLGTVSDADKEKYGLTDPIIISLATDTDKVTLSIGKQTATKEYYYVMRSGDDHAYLVPSSTAQYLAANETTLRYRYIVADTSSPFTVLSLQRDGTDVYTMENQDNTWKMTVPYNLPIALDNSKLSSLTISLQELQIEEFAAKDVTEKDYAAYGVDHPAYQLKLEQENGDTTTLLFAEYDPLVSSYVNCLHVESNEIFTFDSSSLSFLQANASDYLMKSLYSPTMDTVSTLSIQYKGSYNDQTLDFQTTFTMDSSTGTYSCDNTDFSNAGTETVNAFQKLYTQATGLSYEEIQPDAAVPTESGSPALTMTYTLKDGTVHTVQLYANDDKTYWAYIDNQFSYALVRQRALSGNGKMLECYTEFMKAFQEAAS